MSCMELGPALSCALAIRPPRSGSASQYRFTTPTYFAEPSLELFFPNYESLQGESGFLLLNTPGSRGEEPRGARPWSCQFPEMFHIVGTYFPIGFLRFYFVGTYFDIGFSMFSYCRD